MTARSGDSTGRSFLRLLIGDVLGGWADAEDDTREAARRNLVRSTFAAVEGALWLTREHILTVSADMATLTPLATMALREQTYAVTGDGEIIEQMKAVSLGTALRLIEKQARLIDADIRIRFDHHGWAALQVGVKLSYRSTHPKTADDLTVDRDDLVDLRTGLNWFLASVEYVMASTSLAYRAHAEVLQQLIAGDADTLRAYDEALAASGRPD